MKPKQIKRLYTEFGAEIALSSACASSFKRTSPWKHRCILRYLKETYSKFIAGYMQEQTETEEKTKTEVALSDPPAHIWTMWWQGTDDLPEVVRMCYASINRHRGDRPFTVLTRDN